MPPQENSQSQEPEKKVSQPVNQNSPYYKGWGKAKAVPAQTNPQENSTKNPTAKSQLFSKIISSGSNPETTPKEQIIEKNSGPTKNSIPASSEEKQETDKNKIYPIRTFKSDVEQAVKRDNLDSVKIALAEQKNKSRVVPQTATEDHKAGKFAWVVASIVLILIAGGVLFWGFNFLSNQNEPAEIANEPSEVKRLIGVDFEEKINFEDFRFRGDLFQFIKNKRLNEGIGVSKIKDYVFLVAGSEVVSASNFLNRLNVELTPEFTRSLQNEFMLGVHVFDRNHLFLILKTDNFERAFAGMLEWEEVMTRDIGELFFDEVSLTPGGSDIKLQPTYSFSDRIFKNKDVRMLENNFGEELMFYTFLDTQHILITTSENTMEEILNRLKLTKLVR